MYSLQDVTDAIKKSCAKSQEAQTKFQFEVDFNKLENILKQKKMNLHTIGFAKKVGSVPVSITDIQFFTEYIKKDNMFDAIFSNDTEYVSFMLFSTVNEHGSVRPQYVDENGEAIDIPDKDLFNFCNDPDNLNYELIKSVAKSNPIYRVIVVRMFNDRKDQYQYNVNIRSNYQMMEFQKWCKENPDGVTEESEVVNEAPAEEEVSTDASPAEEVATETNTEEVTE